MIDEVNPVFKKAVAVILTLLVLSSVLCMSAEAETTESVGGNGFSAGVLPAYGEENEVVFPDDTDLSEDTADVVHADTDGKDDGTAGEQSVADSAENEDSVVQTSEEASSDEASGERMPAGPGRIVPILVAAAVVAVLIAATVAVAVRKRGAPKE